MTLQGQSQAGVVLRLADATSGFTNTASPKPLVDTYGTQASGFTNTAFSINLFNLTLDTGANNPGAVGLRYIANNQGSVRDVTIRSSDATRRGVRGLDMQSAKLPGPCLLKRVTVLGFDYGLFIGDVEYGVVAEDLTVREQKAAGVRAHMNGLTLRRLTSVNSVPAIMNWHADTFICVIDSSLTTPTGTTSARRAIENSQSGTPGKLFARNITTSGYVAAIQNGATDVAGPNIGEFTSHPAVAAHATALGSLNLPIEETPEPAWDDPSTWISVTSHGATAVPLSVPVSGWGADPNNANDDSVGIQAAIDAATAANRTVYFPPGMYRIGRPVIVRGAVRHLIGNYAEICLNNYTTSPGIQDTTQPIFQFIDGTEQTVVMERFFLSWNTGVGKHHWLQNTRAKDLVVKNVFIAFGQAYQGLGTGKTFIEDVCALAAYSGSTVIDCPPEARPQFKFAAGSRTWARQFNSESRHTHVENNGGTLWVLNLKTERPGTLVATSGGGATEILGGMWYASDENGALTRQSPATDPVDPVFTINGGELSAVMTEMGAANSYSYQNIARETRSGVARTLTLAQCPQRGWDSTTYGAMLPLFVTPGRELFWDKFETGLGAWTAAQGVVGTNFLLVQDGGSQRVKLVQNPASGHSTLRFTAGQASWTNYAVETTIKITRSGTSSASILARYQGLTSWYSFSYHHGLGGRWVIGKRVGATMYNPAQSAPYSLPLGVDKRVRCVLIGSKLELWTQESGGWVKQCELTDPAYSSGKIGLSTYDTDAIYDDLTVEEL